VTADDQELIRELERLNALFGELQKDFMAGFEAFRADMNTGFARIIGKMDDTIETLTELRKERT
jgi:hypothetical protein